MTGHPLVNALAVLVLVTAGWLARRTRWRIPLWVPIVGLVVAILGTTIIGGVAQFRPEPIAFPVFAAIYLGGIVVSLVFTILIFVARRQRQAGADHAPGGRVLVRGAPRPRTPRD